jgi:hypothetical protein
MITLTLICVLGWGFGAKAGNEIRSGLEKAGSGIEKAGSGIEKAGSGIRSGIEKGGIEIGSGIGTAGIYLSKENECMRYYACTRIRAHAHEYYPALLVH